MDLRGEGVSAGFTGQDDESLGWVTQAEIFATPFLIDAARPGRDAAMVHAGVSIWQDAGLSFFVGYQGEFHGNATSHGVTGGIRIGL